MKKINVFRFILLFFLPFLLKAQTIQGNITDPFNGKGISGLVVVIGDSSAISDSLGHYIIHLGLPTSVVENGSTEKVNLPNEFCLKQNFPNPFNPHTKIVFEIPKQSFLELIVYDLKGEKVQTLTWGEYLPGIYSIDFNGSLLSSGVYFYQLITSKYIQVKKMLLIK